MIRAGIEPTAAWTRSPCSLADESRASCQCERRNTCNSRQPLLAFLVKRSAIEDGSVASGSPDDTNGKRGVTNFHDVGLSNRAVG